MRKKAAAFAAAFTAISLIAGCGNGRAVQVSDTGRTELTTAVEAAEEKRPEAKEKILAKYLTGIRDRNILEGARDIDYLSEAGSLEQVITKVEADDKDVDTSKTGVYTVRYRITVDLENLEKAEAYIKEHPEAAVKPDPSEGNGDNNVPPASEATATGSSEDQKPQDEEEGVGDAARTEAGSGEQKEMLTEASEDNREPEDAPGKTGTAPDQERTEKDTEADLKGDALPDIPNSVFEDEEDGTSPRDTAEIIIEKEVRIVTPEEAEEIIRDGGEVWTDKSRPVEPGDLEKDDSAGAGETTGTERKELEEENNTDNSNEAPDSPGSGDGDDAGESSSDDETVSTHTHDWVEQTETIHHEEEGHYETVQTDTDTETVIDEEAWDEPVYDYVQVCSVCGYSTDSDDDIIAHMLGHTDENGDLYGSYGSKRVQVDTIHHPAVSHEEPVYEQEWRVDKKAWDQEVVTGYKCRTCGAEK